MPGPLLSALRDSGRTRVRVPGVVTPGWSNPDLTGRIYAGSALRTIRADKMCVRGWRQDGLLRGATRQTDMTLKAFFWSTLVPMKRTNLVLDEQLLEEVTRISGERTYSRAVTKAIEDYLRRYKAGRILELAGSGLWEGELSR